MKNRKIIDALVIFNDSNPKNLKSCLQAVTLSVITRCPEKYLLVDKETGAVYTGTSKANPYMEGYCLWEEVK